MAVIYFGAAPSGNNKTLSATLAAKGINFLRCAPSSLACRMIAFCLYPMFALFVSCLSAVIFTMATTSNVVITRPGYPISNKHRTPFPFACPAACIGYRKLSSSLRDQLEKAGWHDQEISGKTFLVHATPQQRELTMLLEADSSTNTIELVNFAPFNHLNLQAILDLYEVLNLLAFVSSALHVNHHVLSPNPQHFKEPLGVENMDVDSAAEGVPVAAPIQIPEAGSTSLFSAFFSHPSSLVCGLPKLPGVLAQVYSDAFFSITSLASSHPGLAFSFVPDLAKPDTTTVPDFVERYLIRSLGEDIREQNSVYASIRSSFGLIANTDVGSALAHMVKCMDLSIAGQAKFAPIFTDRFYEGCALIGHGLTYFCGDKVYTSTSVENMTADLLQLSAHERAISSIKEITEWEFRATPSTDSERIENLAFSSMVALRKFCLQELITVEQKAAVLRHAVDLRFASPVLRMTVDNILLVCAICSGAELPEDFPLGSSELFSTDPVRVALSGFGTLAPSFLQPNGVKISLMTDAPPSPPRSEGKTGKKKQETNAAWIAVARRVTLDLAVADWKTMCETGAIRSVPSTVASKAGHWVAKGGQFARVWTALKKVSVSLVPAEDVGKPGKRSRGVEEEDNVEGGVSLVTKRARTFKM